MKNRMILKISAIGENEGFARSAVAAFAAAMEPTIDELSDLKTAVSEAVTNGTENVEEALQPFFTTSGNAERSGMGFTIMQTFTDGCEVESAAGTGTKVRMKKKFGKKAGDNAE